MTPLLAEVDTHLNKPLKDAMRRKYWEYMLGDDKDLDRKKRPTYPKPEDRQLGVGCLGERNLF